MSLVAGWAKEGYGLGGLEWHEAIARTPTLDMYRFLASGRDQLVKLAEEPKRKEASLVVPALSLGPDERRFRLPTCCATSSFAGSRRESIESSLRPGISDTQRRPHPGGPALLESRVGPSV